MDTIELERKNSIEFLIKIGCLIPFSSLDLYHGRTAKGDKPGTEWKVDPNFNNSGNRTGNQNVNAVSLLSTATYETASEFATERNREAYHYRDVNPSTAQVIKIESSDKDALIFNNRFDPNNLDDKTKKQYLNALKTLTKYKLTEFTPLRFEDRDKGKEVYNALKMELIFSHKAIITNDIVEKVYQKSLKEGKGYSLRLINQIAGAYNAKWLLNNYPSVVVKRYTMESDPNKRSTINGIFEDLEGPLNLEYFASWCYNNHIIGVKQAIYSATLGKNISNYMIFDKQKINTEKALGDRMQDIISNFGEIDKSISKFSADTILMRQLLDSSPQESVEIMRKLGFSKQYSLDSGVWEGFSVGEHTETVLRVFENTYKDDIPSSMIPIMKFLILIHDIGKGISVKDGNKPQQKQYTAKFCREEVFDRLKIDPRMQELLIFIIGESQEYTHKMYLPGYDQTTRITNKGKLFTYTNKNLRNFLGRVPTKEEIYGIMNMCKILFACDGGSYSRYAITRDEKTGVFYRNGNDTFTASFANPTDIRKREIKFPEREQG